jgi:predicted thioesterase
MLTASQSAIVSQTLRVALEAATAEIDPTSTESSSKPAHPALPDVGASVSRDLVVSADDTAAAMGHPDDSVQVLGSPRLALWFELVSCELLPGPTDELSHVGVGIVVHHLGRADVGETVTVESTCAAAAGRRVVFTCRAVVGDRVVGLGVHQRALRDLR